MKKQVVVLEDNPNIRELIEYILEDNEIDVVSFDTVTAFLNALTEISPDLFILDIMLPDGSGIDICQRLRSNSETRQTPIVMISAHFSRMPTDCDAEDFIEKPFDIDNFVARVERQIA
ncbi:response regulator transcription factor [Parapedobacter deserti]|uniref:Response regulator transcription factor n=1 Tax=Parapedobacter deserti TaxID=1912957 RepID=A0ABV7JXN3_9SPHI